MNGIYTPWNRRRLMYHSLACLCGLLGALCCLVIDHLCYPPTRLATVDMTGLIRGFVKNEAALPISAEQHREQVQTFSQQLEAVLENIAREQQVILVPKEAVIAGQVPDMTATVAGRITLPDFTPSKESSHANH